MIYVTRDGSKKINGLYASAQFPGQETISELDLEVAAFNSGQAQPDSRLLLARIATLEATVSAIVAIPTISVSLSPAMIAEPVIPNVPIAVS